MASGHTAFVQDGQASAQDFKCRNYAMHLQFFSNPWNHLPFDKLRAATMQRITGSLMGDTIMPGASHDALARNAVRVWLRQVLDEKGWSANEWAVAAKTTPTNITRMLSPTSTSVPNMETVAKLARVARSQPNLINGLADQPTLEELHHPNFCPECGYDLRSVAEAEHKRAAHKG